jgi:MscS family membrane protein
MTFHLLGPARCCVLILAFTSATARAAPPDQEARPESETQQPDAQPSPDEVAARDSPRASMADFLAFARANDYERAAGYLELPRQHAERGAVLARRLKAVLDRMAWVDVEELSPLPSGDVDDGLPRYTDEIARLAGLDGVERPVRLVKRSVDGGRWLFSLSTVAQVDGWYERLADRWLLENLPSWLLRSGPRELLWWQWAALPLVVVIGWLAGYLLSRVSCKLLSYLAARTAYRWDDDLVTRISRPLTLWWALAVMYALLPWLKLYEPAHEFVHSLMRGVFLLGFFWAMSRGIGIGGQLLARSSWALRNKASRSLIPLITRVGHVALIAVAVIALLSQLGYPVASLIAGLGVGGVAVALAAQKTLENLFGAFSIGADQPFREGDFVRIDDFVATVEYIGLRSTRFRTLDRTIITIPNGKLADMKIESFAVRDRLRLACTLSLAHGSTPAQVKTVLRGLDEVLRAQPKLWHEGLTTRLFQLGATSIDIEVMAWFSTTDWSEFQQIREDLLLAFMDVVAQSGTTLATPIQHIRIASDA